MKWLIERLDGGSLDIWEGDKEDIKEELMSIYKTYGTKDFVVYPLTEGKKYGIKTALKVDNDDS